jgi:FkbM family methyltransferase
MGKRDMELNSKQARKSATGGNGPFRLFGRELRIYRRNLRRIPAFVTYFVRCFATFHEPLNVIRCYFHEQTPVGRVLRLRNGMRIQLSDDPLDVVTAFQIFVKREYGRIAPDTTIVDIGGNIGLFALYACSEGAACVHSFEPSEQSFALLQANVAANQLEAHVFASQNAVLGQPSAPIYFPRKSSITNAMIDAPVSVREGADDMAPVSVVTLAEIVRQARTVNFAKIDCEGAEYEILFSTDRKTFDCIDAIALEYHNGHAEKLRAYMGNMGYAAVTTVPEQDGVGGLLFHREAPTNYGVRP